MNGLNHIHNLLAFVGISISNFFTPNALIVHFVSKPLKTFAVNTQQINNYCIKSVQERFLKCIRFNSQNCFQRITAPASSVHLNYPASLH